MARLVDEVIEYLATAICDPPFDGPYLYTWFVDDVQTQAMSDDDTFHTSYDAIGSYTVKCLVNNLSLEDAAEGQVVTTVIDKPVLGWVAPALFKRPNGEVLVIERYPHKIDWVSGPRFDDYCLFVKIHPDKTVEYMNMPTAIMTYFEPVTGPSALLRKSPYWGAGMSEDGRYLMLAFRLVNTLRVASIDLDDPGEKWSYSTIDLGEYFMNPELQGVYPAQPSKYFYHALPFIIPSGGSNFLIGPMMESESRTIDVDQYQNPIQKVIVPYVLDGLGNKIWSAKYVINVDYEYDASDYTDQWWIDYAAAQAKFPYIGYEGIAEININDRYASAVVASAIRYSAANQFCTRVDGIFPISGLTPEKQNNVITCWQGTPALPWESDLSEIVKTPNGFYYKSGGSYISFDISNVGGTLFNHFIHCAQPPVVGCGFYGTIDATYPKGILKTTNFSVPTLIRNEYRVGPIEPPDNPQCDHGISEDPQPPPAGDGFVGTIVSAFTNALTKLIEDPLAPTVTCQNTGIAILDGDGRKFVSCRWNTDGARAYRSVEWLRVPFVGVGEGIVCPDELPAGYGTVSGYNQNQVSNTEYNIFLASYTYVSHTDMLWEGFYQAVRPHDWYSSLPLERPVLNKHVSWTPWPPHGGPERVGGPYGDYWGTGAEVIAFRYWAMVQNGRTGYVSTNMNETTHVHLGPLAFMPSDFLLKFEPENPSGPTEDDFSGTATIDAAKAHNLIYNGLKPWLIRAVPTTHAIVYPLFSFLDPWSAGNWVVSTAGPTTRCPTLSIGLTENNWLFASGDWLMEWVIDRYIWQITPAVTIDVFNPTTNTWTTLNT